MKITFYLPTRDGIPIDWLFQRDWRVSIGFTLFGVDFIKYSNN